MTSNRAQRRGLRLSSSDGLGLEPLREAGDPAALHDVLTEHRLVVSAALLLYLAKPFRLRGERLPRATLKDLADKLPTFGAVLIAFRRRGFGFVVRLPERVVT
jgi:hypothetical protein